MVLAPLTAAKTHLRASPEVGSAQAVTSGVKIDMKMISGKKKKNMK